MKSRLGGVLLASTLFILGMLSGQAMANQPHMQNAKTALLTAQAQLNQAKADKGGHRQKALDLVGQALIEVQAGINYAK
ncbi:hypothetical protein IV102_34670 [bacterium]|nr:hypothetical protein [bacterium]